MSLQTFPDIDGAQNWYATTKDGLLGLRWAVTHCHGISDETQDELFGMSEQDWLDFYHRQIERHEMFATLALFSACEGGIRRDFAWRSQGNNGQRHHARFCKLQERETRKHIALSTLLDTWKGAEQKNAWLGKYFADLSNLFAQRNELAHGSMGKAVAFAPVFERLKHIRVKWREAVTDFRGF